MKRKYHVVNSSSKGAAKTIRNFCQANGQMLLPLVDLISEARLAVDEIIDQPGRSLGSPHETEIEQLVTLYLDGADRDRLDPILDACVAIYKEQLDEDGQVDFKGKAKAFMRTYGFLASILPYTNTAWEKLSIFLNFLHHTARDPISIPPIAGGLGVRVAMERKPCVFASYRGQLDLLNCITRVSEGSEFTALQRLGQAEVIAPVQVDVLMYQWGKMLDVRVPEHVALGA